MGKRVNMVLGVVLAAVLAAALAFVLVPMGGVPDASRLVAVVHDADGGVRELPLSEDARIDVQTDLGRNVVCVEDGQVFVAEADCDNQDCVHQGKLAAPGRQIICLPHKLWVEVVEEGSTGGSLDVSAVAGGSEGLDAVAR